MKQLSGGAAHFALCCRQGERERVSGMAVDVCQPAAGRFVGHAPLTYCHHGTGNLMVPKRSINFPSLLYLNVFKTASHFYPEPDKSTPHPSTFPLYRLPQKLSSHLHLGLLIGPFPSVDPLPLIMCTYEYKHCVSVTIHLNTCLQLVSKLRISGEVLPLPLSPLWPCTGTTVPHA